MRWHGEFAFGEVWLAFRGASADNRFHSHAAVQLVAGGEITVADAAGREFVGPGWLVRSGVRHCLRPAPAMLLVLLDPQSHLAAGLLDALVPDPIAPLPSDLVAELSREGSVADVMVRLQRRTPRDPESIDPRLAAALSLLGRHGSRDAVAGAAKACGLSVSRLRALSQTQFGVPLSKLVMWGKVRSACLAMARGASLADAALDAGFADQAHLTRTMSDVIGLTPGEARAAVD